MLWIVAGIGLFWLATGSLWAAVGMASFAFFAMFALQMFGSQRQAQMGLWGVPLLMGAGMYVWSSYAEINHSRYELVEDWVAEYPALAVDVATALDDGKIVGNEWYELKHSYSEHLAADNTAEAPQPTVSEPPGAAKQRLITQHAS